MARKQDFTLFRGEDVELVVLLDDATDITDWTIALYIRASTESGASALVTRSTSNGGITLTDPEAGEFTVSLPAATTVTLPVTTYRFDLWRLDSGYEVMLAYGNVAVLGQVRHNPLS